MVIDIVGIGNTCKYLFYDGDIPIYITSGQNSVESLEFIEIETLIGKSEIILDEMIVKTGSYFLVWDSESIAYSISKCSHLFDRQVPRLKEESFEFYCLYIKSIQNLITHFYPFEIQGTKVILSSFDKVYEKCRSSGRKPIVLILFLVKEV
jgi:hypothetical protein